MSNGEILNEAEVEFLLKAVADNEPEPEEPQVLGGGEAVTMRGDLEQINLADIFQTLSMSKMEGVLRLRNPLADRDVLCRDGHVRILVPNRVALRRLGQRLLQAGLVTGDQLRDALTQQREKKQPLGEVLVASGALTQEALDDILSGQIAEDLFSLFTWRHGTFEFWKGPPNAPAQAQAFAACPEFEVNSLLLEVARRSDEWQSILDAIGSLEEVGMRLPSPRPGFEPQPIHAEVLGGIDGRASYREIAERTTHGLFEAARAARDLTRAQYVGNLDDAAMVELATQVAQAGDKRHGLVLLQTVRDRIGDRTMETLLAIAKGLEVCGERRLAGTMLLEAAQRQVEPAASLALARKARLLSPNDAATISYLRTVLVAHGKPDAAELEKCTLDLLDAMIAGDQLPSALEIVEDARRTGSLQPAFLVREARARQKSRDVQGAVKVLEELAHMHDSRGEKKAATEAWEAVFRLDRTRADVRKLVSARKRTRVGRWVRVAAALMAGSLLSATGFVVWQQQGLEADLAAANEEVGKALAANDRAAARVRLDHWSERLGECEGIADLRNRVAFADAAEQGRVQKLRRAEANVKLTAAAELLGKGELGASLALYQEIGTDAAFAAEVRDVVGKRLQALLDETTRVAKALPSRLPPMPGALFDRRQLTANLADLQVACPPGLQRAFTELEAMVQKGAWSGCVGTALQTSIAAAVAEASPAFANARTVATAYGEALQRNEQQRELDPLFKAAIECENKNDFAGALARFRELERQPAMEGELRAHFRDRVARHGTIVRLTEALHAATDAGDFAKAQQHLRALRLSFPEVPFDQLVRLPLQVTSEPNGATVTQAGKELGVTPLLLSRTPAETMELVVSMPGFGAAETTVLGDDVGAFCGRLALLPDRTWRHGKPIETQPVAVGDRMLFVDRAGTVTAVRNDGTTAWSWKSGDLSGWLSPPLVHGERILVASLDGDLRGLELASGKVAWTSGDLPTEVAPVLVDDVVVLATTGRRLVAMRTDGSERREVELPAAATGQLWAHGRSILVPADDGSVRAFELPGLRPQWSRATDCQGVASMLCVRGLLVVLDDRGHVVALDAATGERRWSCDIAQEVVGPIVAAGHDLVVPTRSGLLRRNLGTGALGAATRFSETPDGEVQLCGSRCVFPLREGGLQVVDAQSGAPLYRLRAGKKPRVLQLGTAVFVTDDEHVVQAFARLR